MVSAHRVACVKPRLPKHIQKPSHKTGFLRKLWFWKFWEIHQNTCNIYGVRTSGRMRKTTISQKHPKTESQKNEFHEILNLQILISTPKHRQIYGFRTSGRMRKARFPKKKQLKTKSQNMDFYENYDFENSEKYTKTQAKSMVFQNRVACVEPRFPQNHSKTKS